MPIRVFRNDITLVKADAIVNSANPEPIIGGGAEAAIYEAADKKALLAERKKIGEINPGEVAYTPAFKLSAKYIIHTVGPIWQGGSHGEAAILSSCYEKSLELAGKLGCKSTAFPFISTGTYGFPKDKAIEIAAASINRFLKYHKMSVILVVLDKESFKISGKKFSDVASFIEANIVESKLNEEYGEPNDISNRNRRIEFRNRQYMHQRGEEVLPDDISELLKSSQASFSDRVQAMVKQRGMEPSDIYNKDFILTKKIYSDMKTQGDDYRPKKGTAISFCLALELDLPQTLELLGSAGWTLSDSKYVDLIIKWHILKKDFNIRHVNETLNSYGYPKLDKYDK